MQMFETTNQIWIYGIKFMFQTTNQTTFEKHVKHTLESCYLWGPLRR